MHTAGKAILAGVAALALLSLPVAGWGSTASATSPRPSGTEPPSQSLAGFMISSNMHNLCLDIRAWNRENGAALSTFDCHGGNNQRWRWSGQQLVSDHNNRCVDLSEGNPGNGALVEMWDCHGGPEQRWQWSGSQLRHPMTGRCLTIADSNRAKGAALIIRDCANTPNQQWRTT